MPLPNQVAITAVEAIYALGRVVGVLPIDMQEEVVLIRQFQLGGHIALRRGAIIDRADPNEDEYQAAVREC
jgi:hypothetical protein